MENYIVREYWRNYMPGMGNDYFCKQYFYTSFENCNEHILRCPRIVIIKHPDNICKFSQSEDIFIKSEISYNNQIIKTIVFDC